MYVAKSGVVTNHAGVILNNNTSISVPPTGQPFVSTSSWTLSQDAYVMMSSSEMSRFGVKFVTTATPPCEGGMPWHTPHFASARGVVRLRRTERDPRCACREGRALDGTRDARAAFVAPSLEEKRQ
jgi:hypothetical protein